MLGLDPRAAKAAWTVAVLALALFIAYRISDTLLIIVYGIFFAYLIYPLVRVAEHYKPNRLPRTAAIGAVFLLVIAAVAVAAALLGSQIVDEAAKLWAQLPKSVTAANITSHVPLPHFLESERARMSAFITEQFRTGTGQALPFAQRVGATIMHTASNLIYLVLVPIIGFLLIKDAPMLRAEFLMMIGGSKAAIWSGIIEDLDVLLAGYVRALLLLSLATFVSYSVAFSLLGVPYSLLLGGVSALLEFVPFVGPLAAVVIVLVVSAFSDYGHLLWLAAFILAYRLFQDYVLNPYLMSEGVEVTPLLVIVGLLAGEQLGGIPGIFLSVPVIAGIKLVVSRLRLRQHAQKIKQEAVAHQ